MGGIKGHCEPLSSSIRKLSRAELRLLTPVIGSTISAAWQCCELCGTAGQQGRGSRSIAIGIGRNFFSASQGSLQLQS